MSIGDQQAITVARDELKYLVERPALPAILRVLASQLPAYHHGEKSSALSALSRHYTTTIYFDTPSLALLHSAVGGDTYIKLRAREYYDVLPLDELATAEDDLVRSAPILWLELKRRDGYASGKRRVGVPKRRLAGFLHAPAVDPELRAIQQQSLGPEGDEVLAEMLKFLQDFGEPMEASCIVNYARSSFQTADGALRVTVDEELAVYAPNWGVISRDATLTRGRLGQPRWTHAGAVVEVKSLGPAPAWLLRALEMPGVQPTGQSKFITASHAVHGPRP